MNQIPQGAPRAPAAGPGADPAAGPAVDPAALEVEIDDLDPQLLGRGDDLLGKIDVVRRHLRDVDEALDAVADLDEVVGF